MINLCISDRATILQIPILVQQNKQKERLQKQCVYAYKPPPPRTAERTSTGYIFHQTLYLSGSRLALFEGDRLQFHQTLQTLCNGSCLIFLL